MTRFTASHLAWKAIAAVVLAVAAIACANIAAARLSLRFDLTEDRVYTLAPASRALVSGLPDELTVKAYISKDLPPPLAGVARYTRELLEEYRLASGGKLRYEVEDPASDPKIEEQAGRCHIGKLAFQSKNNNQMSVGAYFLGLCLWYDGKNRALTPIERETGLEYEISALAKRMSQKRRKVAFTVGRGERDLGTDYTFIKRALDPEIDVVTLDPGTAPISRRRRRAGGRRPAPPVRRARARRDRALPAHRARRRSSCSTAPTRKTRSGTSRSTSCVRSRPGSSRCSRPTVFASAASWCSIRATFRGQSRAADRPRRRCS